MKIELRRGMAAIATVALAGGVFSSCKSVPPISPDHFSEGYGRTPPIPKAGGAGPPELARPIAAPTTDPLPDTLPQLLDVYREALLARAHLLDERLAREYARKEIASLQEQYQGREEELRAEITRRLRPARPLPEKTGVQCGPRPCYPPDVPLLETEPRREP